jgi:hypothetical protein
MALAMRQDASDVALANAYDLLVKTRPTAINLKWALDEMAHVLKPLPPAQRGAAAYARAAEIADEDVAINQSIGRHGLAIIKDIAARKRPGEINYASVGNGTPAHLSAELFNMMAGVKMTHVPYKGAAASVIVMVPMAPRCNPQASA